MYLLPTALLFSLAAGAVGFFAYLQRPRPDGHAAVEGDDEGPSTL